jgi:tRNA G18 (ribose-2'-O)-methylase SpoU
MKLYLVICNISKYHNVRALLLTAAAFGCHEVLLVGQRKNSDRDGLIPPQFEQAKQEGLIGLQHFSKWNECLSYIQEKSIYLIGVEIDDKSQVLDEKYFKSNGEMLQEKQNVAIFMGNEGQGIHPIHLKACQALVRIPQYGAGTASLNVNVAANIVLYRFHQWMRQLPTST